jgi:hypothetical protein
MLPRTFRVHALALAAALVTFAACSGGGGKSTGPGDDGNNPPPDGGNARPKWAYLVYLAADNNLAADGVGDLDELEAAGVSPDVRVVVQAEFSKEWLGKAGCDESDPQSCINRANWNTFRYVVDGSGTTKNGPNGQTQDLGNVDMTDPAKLREFVLWAKQNYPADHYALVLWNHGGGFTGLIEDATTAGSRLMKVTDLRTALSGEAKVDVVDFDMCLMAAYETLAVLGGAADYVVFSEEVVPGRGNPYTGILNAWKANPSISPRSLSQLFVDQFAADYAGDRASTTKSAYDMAGFSAFETSLNAVAATLRDNVGTLAGPLSEAAAATQSYTFPQLKDLVDLLDAIGDRTTDAGLRAQIDALKTQATGSFRIASRAQNGSSTDAANVDRSSGLHIVLPSGTGDDKFLEDGPASFASYSALYPNTAWTEFLGAYLDADVQGGGPPVTAAIDQGDATRWEVYLLWAEEAVANGVDLDLLILEPSGNLYIPFLGTVTPNGHLTNDSADDQTYYEGYLTNRFIEPGQYFFFASLYSDPQNYQPQFDLFYRQDQSADFQSLWDPDYPSLSKTSPMLSEDADPTFQEAIDGQYNDLKFAGRLEVGTTTAGLRAPTGSSMMRLSVGRSGQSTALARTPTSVQLRVAREAIARWHKVGGKQQLRQRSSVATPTFQLFRGTRMGSVQ